MEQRRVLKTRNVMFRMTQEELDRLDRLAVQEDRNRSQVLRRLVLDGLQRCELPKLMANED